MGDCFYWEIDHGKPSALPNSYFWTWDHSCNWVLDDPGMQFDGCYNRYFKKPETFVEDYRRLTDLSAGLGIKGIVIWGFLRDAHGGVEAAKRVAGYGADRGVAIMPGFGVTWYGGAYYEGDHPYSLATFLRRYPEARLLDERGQPMEVSGEFGACIGHPAFQSWLREAVDWMLREFQIGGFNFENGDFIVDTHPLTQALRRDWPSDDSEVFFHQGQSYQKALDAVGDRLSGLIAAYATYAGFQYCDQLIQDTGMGKRPPAMLRTLPSRSVCQWTLSGMLHRQPLPLTVWLDDGVPDAAFDNPQWPRDLKPGASRNVGFVHQGSQWRGNRYDCVVSWIKEACLRGYRSGLEGISIHGEVSARHVPAALNYLAFSHFTHYPEDSLREFGRRTLGQVLGSPEDGEEYALILAHWDAGTLTDDLKRRADPACHGFTRRIAGSECDDLESYQRYRIWRWLHEMANHTNVWASRLFPV